MASAHDPVAFPWGPLTITAIAGAAYQYGGGVVPSLTPYRDYIMYAAVLFAVLSMLLFFRWVASLGKRSRKAYREGNAKLVELRKQKAILQGQLNQVK